MLYPESYPKGSDSSRTAPSLGFAGVNETVAPRIGMEQCSCQFSYATCFPGCSQRQRRKTETWKHVLQPLLTTLCRKPAGLALEACPGQLQRRAPIREQPHLARVLLRALRQLKAAPASIPDGFIQLMESLLELQDIWASWGNGNSLPPRSAPGTF